MHATPKFGIVEVRALRFYFTGRSGIIASNEDERL